MQLRLNKSYFLLSGSSDFTLHALKLELNPELAKASVGSAIVLLWNRSFPRCLWMNALLQAWLGLGLFISVPSK